MTENEARQVVGVQAHEGGAETPVWTAADRQWATRLAAQTSGTGAPFERFIVERAGHALQRLVPRDAALRRWLQRRPWRPAWVMAAALAALLLGLALDHVGSAQRIDLLSPPVWGVLAWNLAIYLMLLLPASGSGLRRALARRWSRAVPGVDGLWAPAAAPLAMARAGVLLHGAAAAFALGLVGGLYLRGLVLDYRAGWQSTFLEPPAVQALMNTLLAPASQLTGIAVPGVAPLRLAAGGMAAGPAAPWIHLLAATLVLAVVLPRVLLALAAAWRSRRLARRFPLALDGPYFERLRRQQQGGRAVVQVLPHGAPALAAAALGLRTLLSPTLGDDLDLQFTPPVRHGDDDLPPPPAGATLRVLLVDLAATPEAEEHGRVLAALQSGAAALLLADESAFRRRFAGLPERLAERRQAWAALAAAHALPFLGSDLAAPDGVAARPVLEGLMP